MTFEANGGGRRRRQADGGGRRRDGGTLSASQIDLSVGGWLGWFLSVWWAHCTGGIHPVGRPFSHSDRQFIGHSTGALSPHPIDSVSLSTRGSLVSVANFPLSAYVNFAQARRLSCPSMNSEPANSSPSLRGRAPVWNRAPPPLCPAPAPFHTSLSPRPLRALSGAPPPLCRREMSDDPTGREVSAFFSGRRFFQRIN